MTPPRCVSFVVNGTARPKGSHVPFLHRHTKQIILRPASRGLRAWEDAVRHEAQRAMEANPRQFLGAVRVQITFVFQRPQSVSVKRRACMIVAPDLDKICRSCLDGLTGIVFRDDAQVTHLHARKVYGTVEEPSRADLTISELVATAGEPLPLLEQQKDLYATDAR